MEWEGISKECMPETPEDKARKQIDILLETREVRWERLDEDLAYAPNQGSSDFRRQFEQND
jgi:hypothetical protein